MRFHGMLDGDMGTFICDREKLLYLCFNIDQIYDFLLGNGMKPFVELSSMPRALASGDTTVFSFRGNVTPLLSFIPNIGPVIALVPAALIAMVGGIDKLGWVIALYVAVQAFESYLLTPVRQQRMLDLPPALTVGVQVLLGVLAGTLGVILATPLTVAVMVMTQMWYVEDILGDHGSQSD